jgi:hypothetical protein
LTHFKGQEISKANYFVLNSPKKQTKNFYPRIVATTIEVRLGFVFLGELRTRYVCNLLSGFTDL